LTRPATRVAGRRPVEQSIRVVSETFRPDIEGLRALAIGLVLAYHTGAGFARSGFMGVDIFFVISGFLITSVLVGEIQRTGRISLPHFWARRARRLLPAAMVALVFASFVTMQLPITQRPTFGRDVVAAAAYVVNWELLGRSVDYLAEDVGSSPVQHYWSLAIEEQFYVLWPILLVTVLWWARRRQGSWRSAMLVASLAIVGVSLAWSIVATATSPAASYFSTFTRLWELGVGVVIAVLASRLDKLPAGILHAAGWVGVVVLGMAVMTITPHTPWPGVAALLPTLGAAALIVSGLGPPRIVQRALGLGPAVWVGGISYSLYLWHWPMLVAARAVWDVGLAGSIAVVAASFVPAWLSRRLVEDPIRYSVRMRRPRVALLVGAGCSIVAVLAGAVTIGSVRPSIAAIDGSPPVEGSPRPASVPGAGVLLSPEPSLDWATVDIVDRITPNPFDATDDVPVAVSAGCQIGVDAREPRICTYGSTASPRVLALVGDSKAMQWAPALDAIAKAADWRLEIITKSACTFTDAQLMIDGEPYTACTDWSRAVKQRLLDHPPDVLIVGGLAAMGTFGEEARSRAGLAAGYAHLWTDLVSANVKPIVLIDNPAPPSPVYECVAEHPTNLTACVFSFPEREALSGAPTLVSAVALAHVPSIDLRRWICPGLEQCPPVIGNVLVYRQGSHLTATYVMTLVPILADALWLATDGELGTKLEGAPVPAPSTDDP
jgi:peptidoglycan/LPS O-acetylase OafA/YrhL